MVLSYCLVVNSKFYEKLKILYENNIIDKLECFVNNDFVHVQIAKSTTKGILVNLKN